MVFGLLSISCTSQLPDKIKAFFGHNITHMLSKPLKMLKFQRSQQANLFKLSSEYVNIEFTSSASRETDFTMMPISEVQM